MPNPIISEDLIIFAQDARAEEVIALLYDQLAQNSYVEEPYLQVVLDREKQFPTGLPTLPYATAIPHGDPKGVKKTGVAVAILKTPADFLAMDSPKRALPVRLVFLLAVAEKSKQVPMIQWVSNVVRDQDTVRDLVHAGTPKEVMGIINRVAIQNSKAEVR
jgi:PTS system galactitol-specific IIA component